MANAVAMQVDTAEFVAKYASIFCPHRGDSIDVFKKFDLPEHRDILEQAYDYFCRGVPLPADRRGGNDHSEFKIRKIYYAIYDKVFRELGIRGDPAKSRFIERIRGVKRGMPNDVSAADEAWLNEHLNAVLPECLTCGHMMPGTRYADYDCDCIDKYVCMTCHDRRVEVARLNDIACQEEPALARIFVRCPGCNGVDSAGITTHVVPPVVLNQTISDDEEEVHERPRAFQRLDDHVPQPQAEGPIVTQAMIDAERRLQEERDARYRAQAAEHDMRQRQDLLQAQLLIPPTPAPRRHTPSQTDVMKAALKKKKDELEKKRLHAEARTIRREDKLLDRVLAKPEIGVTDEDVDNYERGFMSDYMRAQRAGPSRPTAQTDEVTHEYDEEALNDALAELGWSE